MLKVIIIGILVFVLLVAILMVYACVVAGKRADRGIQEMICIQSERCSKGKKVTVMHGVYSTENRIVDESATVNISGNIIPKTDNKISL